MKTIYQLSALITAMLAVNSGFADTANGFNPYADGKGFDTPAEASWGGWTRGDQGTVYAEWDTFTDSSYGADNDRTAAPDIGKYGSNTVYLGWNVGTFVAGTGNLYNFSVPESYAIHTLYVTAEAPLRAVLQVETTGVQLAYANVTLNGLSPDFHSITFSDANFSSPVGKTDLVHSLFYWDLKESAADYAFNFGGDPHLSLTQVAVDIGPKTAGNSQIVPTRKKLVADFATRLLEIPCVDVRKSAFDGYYNVVLRNTDANSVLNWTVEKAEATTAAACNISATEDIKTHELLQSTGLLGTKIIFAGDELKQRNRKAVADFSYKMFLLPCVEVKNSMLDGYYHVALDIVGNSGGNWSLKEGKIADANACN